VQRYGPSGSYWAENPELPPAPLREWQVWNEPHLQYYWNTEGRGRNAWPREYVRLLKASKPAIEQVDPGATVVMAGLADFAWRHLGRLYRAGVRGHFDVATFNLYTSRPRKVLTGMKLFRRSLRRGGQPRKPMWLTETTWPAAKDRVPIPRPAWQRAWYTTDAGMSRRLRALYVLGIRSRRRFRLERLYWYTWSSGYRDGDLFDYSGLVRWVAGDFEPRPALNTFIEVVRRYRPVGP
jgi:polysaccharide biosynthesis protein PslG